MLIAIDDTSVTGRVVVAHAGRVETVYGVVNKIPTQFSNEVAIACSLCHDKWLVLLFFQVLINSRPVLKQYISVKAVVQDGASLVPFLWSSIHSVHEVNSEQPTRLNSE